ncbi:MAG: T9SS type A sorting domain-containing protein [Candidatus Cloacimonetes bacterium]|nr:T9SS type A sorting domain-containing protein [Candidatus Cloacimonadota bacterium]
MSKLTNFSLALLLLMLLFCCKTFAAQYTIPNHAWSVYAEDLDLDGDNDIVVGHNYSIITEWSGISILENNGYGEFTLIDSMFLYGGQTDIQTKNLNINENPEIIAKYWNPEEENQYLAIIQDSDFNNISYFSLNTYEGVGNITTGDIDNDNDIDIIVASNNGFFWGYLLNNGEGNFSLPTYFDLSFPPQGISCGDVIGDDKEDVFVFGEQIYIYSYPFNNAPFVLDNYNFTTKIASADMDNDGDNDIIGYVYDIFTAGTFFRIYENLGNENFSLNEIYYDFGMSRFLLSDVNEDGLIDLLGFEYILYNEGDLNFSEPEYYTIITDTMNDDHRDYFCSDLDGNGYDDMIVLRNFGQSEPSLLKVVFNDGEGNFVQEPQNSVEPPSPQSSQIHLTLSPNPFRAQANIQFSIKKRSFVELNIYDIRGRLVKELSQQTMEGGEHNVIWKGKNRNNRSCSSGIYLMNLKSNKTNVKTKKIILLK